MTTTEHWHNEEMRATLQPGEYIKICSCGYWLYVYEYPDQVANVSGPWESNKGKPLTELMMNITRGRMPKEEMTKIRRRQFHDTNSSHMHNIIMLCLQFQKSPKQRSCLRWN